MKCLCQCQVMYSNMNSHCCPHWKLDIYWCMMYRFQCSIPLMHYLYLTPVHHAKYIQDHNGQCPVMFHPCRPVLWIVLAPFMMRIVLYDNTCRIYLTLIRWFNVNFIICYSVCLVYLWASWYFLFIYYNICILGKPIYTTTLYSHLVPSRRK